MKYKKETHTSGDIFKRTVFPTLISVTVKHFYIHKNSDSIKFYKVPIVSCLPA